MITDAGVSRYPSSERLFEARNPGSFFLEFTMRNAETRGRLTSGPWPQRSLRQVDNEATI